MSEDEDAREVARQQRIADACTVADGAAPGRLGVYRQLVQNNLAAIARRLLPRTVSELNEGGSRCFEAWFTRFLSESGPTTPYLRDVPAEFVRWAIPRWRASPDVLPSLSHLARYELDRFEIETAPRTPPPNVTEVAVDRPLVFAQPRKLARYAYAVQAPDDLREPRETRLLLYRDEDNEVHVFVVEERTHALLSLLLACVPLDQAIETAPAGSREDVARWLAELADAGALLGGTLLGDSIATAKS